MSKKIPVGRAPLVPREDVKKAIEALSLQPSARIVTDVEPPWPKPRITLERALEVVVDVAIASAVLGGTLALWKWVLS